MKTLIAFFYLLNGEVVSYTVSDYGTFQQTEGLPEWLSCEMLVEDDQFADDVRVDLQKGESMRANCYRTNDILQLGNAYRSVTIAPY